MGSFFPFGMEEVGRQNIAMMERAMSLFAPFARPGEAADARPGSISAGAAPLDEVAALRAEVEFLRAQLARLPKFAPSAEGEAASSDDVPVVRKAALQKE
jgi:hypothetical protein